MSVMMCWIGIGLILIGLVAIGIFGGEFPRVFLMGSFLMLGGLGIFVWGLVIGSEEVRSELNEKVAELDKKWERLEGEVKGRVVEETGEFDVEVISKSGEEKYYNVRSGEELYRVYYKNFNVVGIEQNDKFIFAKDE